MLSDADKRGPVRPVGHAGVDPNFGAGGGAGGFGGGFGGVDFGDIFETFFGGGGGGFGGGQARTSRANGPRQGGDIRVQVVLP